MSPLLGPFTQHVGVRNVFIICQIWNSIRFKVLATNIFRKIFDKKYENIFLRSLIAESELWFIYETKHSLAIHCCSVVFATFVISEDKTTFTESRFWNLFIHSCLFMTTFLFCMLLKDICQRLNMLYAQLIFSIVITLTALLKCASVEECECWSVRVLKSVSIEVCRCWSVRVLKCASVVVGCFDWF